MGRPELITGWGYVKESLSEIRPPNSEFSTDDIGDLTGQVHLVTGGNTGIGEQCVRVLASKGAKVYLACRNKEKGEAAIKRIGQGDIHLLILDLGSVKAAHAAAEEFRSREKKLHVLYNSAGVMAPPTGSRTSDNLELQFGTNVLGHYVFTQGILPVLLQTAKSAPKGQVRIVNTSSSGHAILPKEGINFDSLTTLQSQAYLGKADIFIKYGQSKLGNVLLTNEWAARHPELIVLSCNPGNIKSDLQRTTGSLLNMFISPGLFPVSKGALTQLWGGTSPTIDQSKSGSYLIPWARFGHVKTPFAVDAALQSKVVDWCEAESKKLLSA
ncbi:uncharacterized protein L969DRAFT_86038 [Mixia osmundae IAM 14324]|uniref:uncharacterized protein n=1 Tax=Mixia osmundae (strain CBS 9802 / IAM 14324 / JCM 22182 / KY 12970) TaxID=764103 RepID=UPI0004A54993|nr:uncharacterized protein L969DRAFT_86038 [Mixia osmundae IAM 14324]KEI40812.1 hypothetical protein L969DRAFT_86038 [Mixia osmundae IAM 14324]